MDDEYGTIGGAGSPYEPKWPYRNLGNSDIFASFAMQCGLNEYAPEGRPMHEVNPLFIHLTLSFCQNFGSDF